MVVQPRRDAAVPGQHPPDNVRTNVISVINERDFNAIRTWLYETAGIHLSAQKKALVRGGLRRDCAITNWPAMATISIY